MAANAKESRDKVSARCPAHDDKNPSLSLDQGDDGSALLHCHALCDTKDVLARLDLRMSDLFPGRIAAHGDGAAPTGQRKDRRLDQRTSRTHLCLGAFRKLWMRIGVRSTRISTRFKERATLSPW